MLKKVLITGISGFVGSHLVEYLLTRRRYEISGTYLTGESLQVIAKTKQKLLLKKVDLMKAGKVRELIKELQPEYVFHLAALSSPADSFNRPQETMANNIFAELNLLEAIRKENLKDARTLIVSSGDIYGPVSKEDLPIDEDTKLMPTSPYSVSKITQDFLGLQYFLAYGLQIIRVRSFNHLGPRQSPNFVLSAFAKKVAEIEKNKREPVLEVGNLESKRDFTDVRDIVVAYELLLEKGKAGEVYNLGSGVSHKIADVLKILLSFSKVKIKVKVNPVLFRPSDIPELLCDNRKLKETTVWETKIPIEKTIKDTLDYWRGMV